MARLRSRRSGTVSPDEIAIINNLKGNTVQIWPHQATPLGLRVGVLRRDRKAPFGYCEGPCRNADLTEPGQPTVVRVDRYDASGKQPIVTISQGLPDLAAMQQHSVANVNTLYKADADGSCK